MYVKLRDKGTIFHDGSQDVSVTGELPVEVKGTAKIKIGVKDGILIEVEKSEAEALIAKSKGEAKKQPSGAEIKHVAKLEGELKETSEALTAAKAELETAKSESALFVETNAALETAKAENATLVETNDALAAELKAKSEAYDTLKESIKDTGKK